MRSLAYGSRLKNQPVGNGVCIYPYLGCTPSVSEPSLSSDGTCSVSGRGGCRLGGGAPVPFCLKRVSSFFAVPVWQGRQRSMWFSQTSAECLLITAFTMSCPGYTTPHFCCSRTSAWGCSISYCVSSIAACESHPISILVIFKARRMSHYSSCIRPPCVNIIADMSKTYKN
jgi:hypothetical protein